MEAGALQEVMQSVGDPKVTYRLHHLRIGVLNHWSKFNTFNSVLVAEFTHARLAHGNGKYQPANKTVLPTPRYTQGKSIITPENSCKCLC